MKKKKSLSVVIVIASLLLAIMLMDTWILFTQTHTQTKQLGVYQLESTGGKLESTINDAENLTMELAIKAGEHLDDFASLKDFIYSQKKEIISGETGAFNVYIAGSDFSIIPDFVMPEGYVTTERVWYLGALKNKGKAYVSSPYQDAMTGEICYSVSVMLGDKDTVIAVDYTLENIRNYISQMSDKAYESVIVTDEGMIAGCSDDSKIGKKLVDEMPDYAGIYASAKNKSGVATGRIKEGLFHEELFATGSGNGWYLIVKVSDWELYKSSYIQLSVTIILSLALFAVIIMLYLASVRNRERAEEAFLSREEFLSHITTQLAEPLGRILDRSSRENYDNSDDFEEDMASIHSAGESLSEMMSQLMSYKSIVLSNEKEKISESGHVKGMDKRFRTIIIVIMSIVMVLSLYTSVSSAYQSADANLKKDAGNYEFKLSEWINTQKSILDMFVSTISTNPEMLDDYEGTVSYLNDITLQYPEISVTYMTNPKLKHTVYMSNGWEPDDNWKVEERQWYIDTMASKAGWSISAPYYDEQTGGYCLTISKIVYDAKTEEFLGVFGIDFFMDKLVNILGDSYSENGYAFLVDPDGEIINHPYGSYQMTQDNSTNVADLPYGQITTDGQTTELFKDYDGSHKIVIATRNKDTNFSVYVVSDVMNFYGKVILYGVICILAFLFCIILVYRLLT
nr:histidine kinase [Lachnospiraceae bacterium]